MQLTPKSKKGDKKVYLWMLLDEGGTFRSVCYEAPDPKSLLHPKHWAKASGHAYRAFTRHTGVTPDLGSVIDSGLVGVNGMPLV